MALLIADDGLKRATQAQLSKTTPRTIGGSTEVHLPFSTRLTGYEKTLPVDRLAVTGSLSCDERRCHHPGRGIFFLGKFKSNIAHWHSIPQPGHHPTNT